MQGLRRSLISSLFSLRVAVHRVCSSAAGGSMINGARLSVAAEPQVAAISRWGFTVAMDSSTGAAPACSRWSSSTAAPGGDDGGVAAVNSLTRHQALKRLLKPQNSGRLRFKRNWQRKLQIKWNAKERKANEMAARKRLHEKRLQQFKQRSEWAAAMRQQAA